MPDTTVTVTQPHPLRRWSYPYEITLSDTNTDKNLQRNGIGYKYIQNVGTAGLVNIYWQNGTTVDIYLGQGQEIEGGLWQNARVTGTAAGVVLRGFVGMAGLGV